MFTFIFVFVFVFTIAFPTQISSRFRSSRAIESKSVVPYQRRSLMNRASFKVKQKRNTLPQNIVYVPLQTTAVTANNYSLPPVSRFIFFYFFIFYEQDERQWWRVCFIYFKI